MKPLRLAVMGAGLVGRRHIQTIWLCPKWPNWCRDRRSGGRPRALAVERRRPGSTTPPDMLARAKPEAAIIATPTGLHAAQGLLCSARGVHFLVEKPVTATLEEADTLVRAVEDSGVKTLVGHHRRYLAAVQEARRVIAASELGTLVAASVLWATRKPGPPFPRRGVASPSQAGGPLLINAIHEIDLLRHLCGEIRLVSGLQSRTARVRGGGQRRRLVPVRQWVPAPDPDRRGPVAMDHRAGQRRKSQLSQSGRAPMGWVSTQGKALELPVLRSWRGHNIAGRISWDKPLAVTDMPPAYPGSLRSAAQAFPARDPQR